MFRIHASHVDTNHARMQIGNMDNKDLFIRPPEKILDPYQVVTSEPLWDFDRDYAPAEWPPARYCTDEEAAALSSVPERSLLLLQTAEVIHACKASAGAGPNRRVWHLAHVAAATVVECIKRASGLDYRGTAQIAREASIYTRNAFYWYLNLQKIKKLGAFSAELIVEDRAVFLKVSKNLRLIDPVLRNFATKGNTLSIAEIENGVSTPIDPENLERQQAALAALNDSRFQITVNLKNVFAKFERQARELRKGNVK